MRRGGARRTGDRWVAHDATGVAFALVLLADWPRSPTILPALTLGVATIVAPGS